MTPVTTSSSSTLSEIAALPREELLARLIHFHGKFTFDFSEAYLSLKSTEELRHILLAALKHAASES
jgi:hypothetical protein